MSRDREVEIDALRRENEQLRREVARRREAGRARRHDAPPAAAQDTAHRPSDERTGLDGDRLAERLEDVITAMCVELTESVGAGVRSITCKLEEFHSAQPEETPERDRELLLRLEQLSTELKRLRLELAATRLRIGDASENDELLDEVVSIPGIVIEQGEPRNRGSEHRWRRTRRPWFYVPLVWGLVLLVVVLVALLVWW